jgi:hypothetical protein
LTRREYHHGHGQVFFDSNVFLKPIPECAHKLQYMPKQGLIMTKQQKT